MCAHSRYWLTMTFDDHSRRVVPFQCDEVGAYACQLLANSMRALQTAPAGQEHETLLALGLTRKMVKEHMAHVQYVDCNENLVCKQIKHLEIKMETLHE